MKVLTAAALLAIALSANAQIIDYRWVDPSLHWRTVDSEHFSAHFAESYRAQAYAVLAIAESVYPRVTGTLAWEPRLRTHLVLLDSADFANGFASPLPFNGVAIFLSPPDEGELLQNRAWIELVLTHEFFHIVHLDKASGPPLGLRDVFGRLPPLFPNLLQPSWVIEGLAVDAESEAASGYGRLGHSYFEGMMRAEAARGFRSLREVNAEGRGFPLNRDYLYGSYFFAFLRDRYGASAVTRFVEGYSGNVVPFKVDSNARQATDKPMDALWLEYQEWLRARFAAPRPEVQQGDELVRAFSVESPTLTSGGARWYVQADGYTRPRLMRQASGEAPRTVRRTERDTRLSAGPAEDLLMAELELCRNYNLYYELHRVTPGGRRERLAPCDRYRFAAPHANGRIVAVRVISGRAQVVELGAGKLERVLYEAAAGESISGLASNGKEVFVTSLRQGGWSLSDVSQGRAQVLLSDRAVKHSPRSGERDGEVFFVADYGGSYDVWSFVRAERTLRRWTQSAYGVREISAPMKGEILLTTLEAQGVALRTYRLPPSPLEARPAGDATPLPETVPSRPVAEEAAERAYSPLPTLRPTAWLPLVDIADGAVAVGAVTYGQDALALHQYLVAPMVELTQREPLGHAEYVYDGRHALVVNRTLDVRATADDGGRTKIRAYGIRENAQWISTWRQLALNRRLYWGLGAALENEKHHDLDVGTTTVQDERVVGLVAGVDTRRMQWLSEGPTEGQQLRLFAETSRGLGGTYSGGVLRADWRGHLALGRTVAALRWNEAYGQREAEPFELGGSRSDDYTALPVLNERQFALRGYTTGEPTLTGHRARVVSAEWRVPLADIDRHLMVPPVGINRVGLVLFFDVGAAWERGSTPDYHRGTGAELVSEPRFGYLLGFQMRAGVAKGLDAPGSTRIYLRAGRAF